MSARQGLSNLASLSVSRVALNPVVAGALLWALIRGPASVRGRLINSVSALRNPQTRARVTKLLGWLLALGVVRTVNKKLNHLALNAYRTNDEQKRWQWNEEVAVVTGGCSGIGMLTAKRLLLRGVKVAILDIQQLPPALRDCAGVGFFACDVSDPAAVASTADEVRATLGPPSILVNNAGITHPHTILQTSPEYLRRIFDINLLSNWYTIQAFLPHMIEENKGHVVTVASMASYWSVGGMVDYCATKAAVLCLHEGRTPFPLPSPPPHSSDPSLTQSHRACTGGQAEARGPEPSLHVGASPLRPDALGRPICRQTDGRGAVGACRSGGRNRRAGVGLRGGSDLPTRECVPGHAGSRMAELGAGASQR
ncbi:hypothetical protein PMIN02_000369 [Paraphaeosphaeria minitans]